VFFLTFGPSIIANFMAVKLIIASIFFLVFCTSETYGQLDSLNADNGIDYRGRQRTLIFGGAGLYASLRGINKMTNVRFTYLMIAKNGC